jgi:AcrR family transcriptional regulator
MRDRGKRVAADAPPAKNRLGARSEASIDALLQVARRSFGRDGYGQVSLESVAAAARMTKGAVYHHFGSKEALFEAVYRREHQGMIALVMSRSASATDPLDAIVRGMRAYLSAILEPEARRILLVDGPSVLGWERWRRCEEPGFQHLLERSLTAAAKRDLLRSTLHVAATATLLLGAVTEAALTVAHAPDPTATSRKLAAELAAHVAALGR